MTREERRARAERVNREVGARLAAARTGRTGLGRREAAARVGMSWAWLQSVETGRRAIAVADLDALCAVYGVSPGDMLEDAPAAADARLLALANRTLTADLEAAQAEIARLRGLPERLVAVAAALARGEIEEEAPRLALSCEVTEVGRVLREVATACPGGGR